MEVSVREEVRGIREIGGVGAQVRQVATCFKWASLKTVDSKHFRKEKS